MEVDKMAYMTVDPIEGQRGVIRRAAEEFSRRASEFLDPTEDWNGYFDNDGLGVHIGIQSIRARKLLASLEKSIFRGFQAHRFEHENGMVWARFGYSDF
jgi:hypothetical protein